LGTQLERHTRDWDDLAVLDPLWAIFPLPGGRSRLELDDFFATGALEVDAVLEEAKRLGQPQRWAKALDFGCGLGRATRALARHFESVVGVDVSEEMVTRARELNAQVLNSSFAVNLSAHLAQFEADSFDFVYSSFVLQHLPSAETARAYIREFLRITQPDGLVVFQMPDRLPWRRRLQLRRRVYSALRVARVPRKVLYDRLRLHPVRLISLSREDVERLVEELGGAVLLSAAIDAVEPIAGYRYFVAPSE
jgi:SAM-dependent methyltransferase